jgi:hypothetical protein
MIVATVVVSAACAVMESGRIVQLGVPNDIYYRPKSRFVASFIGHANFISGEVSAVDGGVIPGRSCRANAALFLGRLDRPSVPEPKVGGSAFFRNSICTCNFVLLTTYQTSILC